MNLADATKLKYSTVSSIVICITAFFSAEFLLFLLDRKLFMTLDIYRLVGIGVAIAGPILLCNSAVMGVNTFLKNKYNPAASEDNEKMTWTVAGTLSISIISLISLIGYSYKFSIQHALWVLFWVEISIFAVFIILMIITMYHHDGFEVETSFVPNPPKSQGIFSVQTIQMAREAVLKESKIQEIPNLTDRLERLFNYTVSNYLRKQFDSIYAIVMDSQLELLEVVNGNGSYKKEDLIGFYNTSKEQFTEDITITYDDYFQFFISFNLIIIGEDGCCKITWTGRDFLKYLVDAGKTRQVITKKP